MSTAPYTAGPWRWEISMESKRLHLVGGLRPKYDLTIIDFERWGMGNATMCLRDTAHDGMNLMHKLHERPDWIEPFPGRAHHARWCQNVVHPDARLIAAAPDLLEAQTMGVEVNTPDFLDWIADRLVQVHKESQNVDFVLSLRERAKAGRAAIAKATGAATPGCGEGGK